MTQHRIVVRGPVPSHILDTYRDEFTITETATSTVLAGRIVDSAQLEGLVSHLESAHLDIIEIISN